MEDTEFYNRVGKTNGWDFSSIHSRSEGVAWDFYEEVKKYSKPSDVLLDIGTGGGEQVLKIASSVFFLVGIDLSGEMVKTAKVNLRKTANSNVRFFQQSSEKLLFPDGFFDIVSARHAPFNAFEVARALKKGGFFLTQQVSEGDKLNLKAAFGRGQCFEERDGTLKEQYVHELKKAGFSEVAAFDYNVIEYFQSPEDLMFLLKHAPIIPDFGKENRDFNVLKEFIEKNKTEKGIRTNTKRFMILAKL